MMDLLDIESLSIPVLDLASPGPEAAPNGGVKCASCVAHRPAPRPDGSLRVDPEIVLPSPGMDVEIGYFYNSSAPTNGPYGFGRTITPNRLIESSLAVVTLSYGDGTQAIYQNQGPRDRSGRSTCAVARLPEMQLVEANVVGLWTLLGLCNGLLV